MADESVTTRISRSSLHFLFLFLVILLTPGSLMCGETLVKPSLTVISKTQGGTASIISVTNSRFSGNGRIRRERGGMICFHPVRGGKVPVPVPITVLLPKKKGISLLRQPTRLVSLPAALIIYAASNSPLICCVHPYVVPVHRASSLICRMCPYVVPVGER